MGYPKCMEYKSLKGILSNSGLMYMSGRLYYKIQTDICISVRQRFLGFVQFKVELLANGKKKRSLLQENQILNAADNGIFQPVLLLT